jgi:hypothetical protein
MLVGDGIGVADLVWCCFPAVPDPAPSYSRSDHLVRYAGSESRWCGERWRGDKLPILGG